MIWVIWGFTILFSIVMISAVVFWTKAPKPRPPGKVIIARMSDVSIPCAVCGEALRAGEPVAYREGEWPWHAHHKTPGAS
jgi:hypothetical protein